MSPWEFEDRLVQLEDEARDAMRKATDLDLRHWNKVLCRLRSRLAEIPPALLNYRRIERANKLNPPPFSPPMHPCFTGD
jgi:hypothetical protein